MAPRPSLLCRGMEVRANYDCDYLTRSAKRRMIWQIRVLPIRL